MDIRLLYCCSRLGVCDCVLLSFPTLLERLMTAFMPVLAYILFFLRCACVSPRSQEEKAAAKAVAFTLRRVKRMGRHAARCFVMLKYCEEQRKLPQVAEDVDASSLYPYEEGSMSDSAMFAAKHAAYEGAIPREVRSCLLGRALCGAQRCCALVTSLPQTLVYAAVLTGFVFSLL